MRNVEERRLGVRPHVVDTTITPPHGRRLRPRVAAVQPVLGRMIRRVVPSNFPSSTVDGGRFVPRLVSHGRHSSVLAVDAPSAASRRPGPRRLRPRPWCLVGAPARRRRRGAFCGNGRAEHAADSPRVAPDRCYGRMFPLDECSDVRGHRHFQLLVLLADRALLRRREALGSWCGDDPRDAGVVGLAPAAHRHGVAGLKIHTVRAVRAAVGAPARVPLRAAAVAHLYGRAVALDADKTDCARAAGRLPTKQSGGSATASRVSNRCRACGLSRARGLRSSVVHFWWLPTAFCQGEASAAAGRSPDATRVESPG